MSAESQQWSQDRVLAELQQLSQEMAELAAVSLWSLSDDELIDMLRWVHRRKQTVNAVRAQLQHQADIRGLPALGATPV